MKQPTPSQHFDTKHLNVLTDRCTMLTPACG
jgi:hypothetical protein